MLSVNLTPIPTRFHERFSSMNQSSPVTACHPREFSASEQREPQQFEMETGLLQPYSCARLTHTRRPFRFRWFHPGSTHTTKRKIGWCGTKRSTRARSTNLFTRLAGFQSLVCGDGFCGYSGKPEGSFLQWRKWCAFPCDRHRSTLSWASILASRGDCMVLSTVNRSTEEE